MTGVEYEWRGAISNTEMVALVDFQGGNSQAGWWNRVRPHSLGWVVAPVDDNIVGFVNVAWDGGDHAFLIDTKVRRDMQRRGVGSRVAADSAAGAPLHVSITAFRDSLPKAVRSASAWLTVAQ